MRSPHLTTRAGVRAATLLMSLLFAIGAGAACGKKPLTGEDPRAPCVMRVGALRHWLAGVAAEGEVYAEVVPGPDQFRYADRPLPTFALAPVDEAPASPPPVAIVAVHRGTARFADVVAKASEPAALDDVMGKVSGSGLSPGFGSGRVGRSHFHMSLVMLIGADERWVDVAAIMQAVARGGFTTVHFTFAVKTSVTPLGEAPSSKRIVALATNANEMPWKRDVAVAAELARLNPSCPGVAQPFAAQATDNVAMLAQRTEFMARAADEVAACACRADLDAVKALAWTRFGRAWGAPTKAYALEIAPPHRDAEDGPAEELIAPASATWRAMSTRVIALSRKNAVVSFRAE